MRTLGKEKMRRVFGNWIVLARFARRFKSVRRNGLRANLLGGLATCFQLSIPLATVKIINKAIPAKNYHLLIELTLLMAIAAILAVVVSSLESYYSCVFRERASILLEMLLFKHIQYQPQQFFKSNDSGYIMSRISNDNSVALELVSSFTTLGRTGAMLLAGMIVLPVFHFKLALVILCVLPLYAGMLFFFSLRTRQAFAIISEKTALASKELFESLTGIYETKAYGSEKYRVRRYMARLGDRARAFVRGRFLMTTGEQITQAITFLFSFVMIGYGGASVIAGRLSLGELIGFTTVVAYLFFPVNLAVQHVLRGQRSFAAIQRLEEWLNMPEEPIEQRTVDSSSEVSFRACGHVKFDDVTFAYQGGPVLLEGVSFEVMPGEAVLITGASGAGKTTLVSLVPRFLEPLSGTIYLDDIPLKLIPLKELRRQVAYVSQDIFLFSDTVANNIRLGNANVSDEELYEAARLANAVEFIEALPEGFKTQVGERGVRLSGGQRQRIAIARALVHNAPILILDEATSAVDPETEASVHESLARLMKDRTTIIIAHHATAFIETVSTVFALEDRHLRLLLFDSRLAANTGSVLS